MAMAEADKLATGERILIEPTDALLVIDVMKTFMPGGGLAVPGGHEVVPVIKRVMPAFPKLRRIATKERHPIGHIALASSYRAIAPKTRMTFELLHRRVYEVGVTQVLAPHAKFTMQDLREYLEAVGAFMLWDDHSIAGTDEAELHPDLPESEFGYVLITGLDPREHAYSACRGDAGTPTELMDVLRARGVTRVFCCGLAFDYCVGWTAVFLVDEGFQVVVIEDATRSVGVPDTSVGAMLNRLSLKGIRLVQADQLCGAASSDELTTVERRAARSRDICGND